VATGRRPIIEGANLEAAGVKYDKQRIITDEICPIRESLARPTRSMIRDLSGVSTFVLLLAQLLNLFYCDALTSLAIP
jgi:hypothetical protein